MDAQDSSADVVEVEASGRCKSNAAAAVRARAVDYQPIVNDTVAALAPNTAHKRRKVYAQARLVVAHGLMSGGLAAEIVEIEKLALDLAIERVEHRWRLKRAAEKLTLENSAAAQEVPAAARSNGGRATRGSRPPLEIGWRRFRSLRQAAETLLYAVSARGAIRWGVVRTGNEARPPAIPDPSRQPRGKSLARSRPAPMRATRFNGPSPIAIASNAARLPRGLAQTVVVAVALPVIAAMIILVSRIDRTVTSTSAGGDRVGRSFLDRRGGPGVKTATAVDDASGARARAAPIHARFRAAHDAPAPSRASGGATGAGVACDPGPCARDIAGGRAPVEAPKTQAGPPWLESYSRLSDMTWGIGPSNALRGPTVAAEDFVVHRVTADAAPAAAAALASPAAVPGAAATLASPAAAPGAAATLASPAAAPGAAATQAPESPANPINPKTVALIASGKQAVLKGDLDHAVRDFGEAIRTDPNYPDSYLARGQAYFNLGETERAIADYSAAVAHDPQQAAAFRARGMANLYLGKNDLALTDLSKAIELGEKDPQLLTPIELFFARRSRGAIYDSRQQYDEEIADCTALIEAAAHDPVLAEALAANYGTAGSANALAKLYRQRGNALARTSNVEQGVADLTEAIRLSSDRGYAALLDRAKLHELLGRRDLAVADARAALKIRPKSEEARLALSRLSGLSKPTPPKGL